jgi:uncharacterized membrane protein YphA (DoxX/SURF4 family)
LFSAILLGVIVRPRSPWLLGSVVVALTILFLQDQSRAWPSFYEFFFLFLLLLTHRSDQGENSARRILAGMRFVVAAVYFWGGVQKLTPRFVHEEFPWFIQPLTDLLPFDLPYVPALGVFAALFEVLFGIGLLTNRFRRIALYEALLMHALILVCIGPLRGDWNNSAWIWGQTMAVQVWVLFYRAPAFDFRTMFSGPRLSNVPPALAVVFLGVLPVLNNVNRWDSALSYNIYTGNVSYGEIYLSPAAARGLPVELSAHVSERDGIARLDLNAWTMREFNANPYPERRIFKAVLGRICSLVPDGSAELVVHEKSGWFIPQATRRYDCA